MSKIRIDTDSVQNLSNSLARNCSNISNVKGSFDSLRHKIDGRILNRNGIGPRVNNAYSSVSKADDAVKKLIAFLNESVEKYNLCEVDINKLAAKVEAFKLAEPGSYNPDVKQPGNSESNNRAEDNREEPKKPSWLRNLMSHIPYLNEAEQAVAGFAENIEEGGKWHKAWEIGKAVVGVAGGVTEATLALLGEVGSEGVATPIAAGIFVMGVNNATSSLTDLYNLTFGDEDEVGKNNLIENGMVAAGSLVGKQLGNEQAGKLVGDLAYTGIDALGGAIVGNPESLDKGVRILTHVSNAAGYAENVVNTVNDTAETITSADEFIDDPSLKNAGKLGVNVAKDSVDVIMDKSAMKDFKDEYHLNKNASSAISNAAKGAENAAESTVNRTVNSMENSTGKAVVNAASSADGSASSAISNAAKASSGRPVNPTDIGVNKVHDNPFTTDKISIDVKASTGRPVTPTDIGANKIHEGLITEDVIKETTLDVGREAPEKFNEYFGEDEGKSKNE